MMGDGCGKAWLFVTEGKREWSNNKHIWPFVRKTEGLCNEDFKGTVMARITEWKDSDWLRSVERQN